MPRSKSVPEKGGGKGKKHLQSEESSASLIGSDADDNLVGTDGDDQMFGYGGDDTLSGLAGINEMDGGNGSDTYVVYGRGSVTVANDTGTEGHDVITGDPGGLPGWCRVSLPPDPASRS